MSAPAPETPAAPAPETAEDRLKRRQFYLSVVSSVVLIGGGFGSIYQYFAQQEKIAKDQLTQQQNDAEARKLTAQKEADQREEIAKREGAQREKEAELRRRELALMIYREKKEAYGLLVDAATDVATAKDRAEVEARTGKFYAVYYGRIHIIPELDQSVQDAKNEFEKKLRKYRDDKNDTTKPLDVFSSQLNDISSACQKGLDCHKLFQKQDPKPQTAPPSITPIFGIQVPTPSGGQGSPPVP